MTFDVIYEQKFHNQTALENCVLYLFSNCCSNYDNGLTDMRNLFAIISYFYYMQYISKNSIKYVIIYVNYIKIFINMNLIVRLPLKSKNFLTDSVNVLIIILIFLLHIFIILLN